MNYGTFGKGSVEDPHNFLVVLYHLIFNYGIKDQVPQKYFLQLQLLSRIFTAFGNKLLYCSQTWCYLDCIYLEILPGKSYNCLSH